MKVTNCKQDGCVNDLLQRVLDYGERMIKEPPYSLYEMVDVLVWYGMCGGGYDV